jgi:hypothetical protein
VGKEVFIGKGATVGVSQETHMRLFVSKWGSGVTRVPVEVPS